MKEVNNIIKTQSSSFETIDNNFSLVSSLLTASELQESSLARIKEYFNNGHGINGLALLLVSHRLNPKQLQLIQEKFKKNETFGSAIPASISANLHINWNIELLTQYNNILDWNVISISNNVDWSDELIETFIDKFNWAELSKNESIPFTEALLLKFSSQWTWNHLSCNFSIINKENLLIAFSESFNWDLISMNLKDSLSTNFLKETSNILNWAELSKNKELIWTMAQLVEFENKFNKSLLGFNPNLPWEECIKTNYFSNFYSSSGLFHCDSMIWTKGEIRGLFEKADYSDLISIKQFQWDHEFILELAEQYDCMPRWADNFYPALCLNHTIIWTEELFEIFISRPNFTDNWNFVNGGSMENSGLNFSINPSLPWSETFIGKHHDKWDWKELSRNTGIPWSKDLLLKYTDKWDWDQLKINPALPWNNELLIQFKDKWLVDHDEYGDPDKYYWPSIYDNKAINWNIEVLMASQDLSITFEDINLNGDLSYHERNALRSYRSGFQPGVRESIYISICKMLTHSQVEELLDCLIENEFSNGNN